MQKKFCLLIAALSLAIWVSNGTAAADKPNILVIWGDDIGWSNISKYNHGMMGYKTPNIDRIADEGAINTAYRKQPAWPILVNLKADPYETAWKESAMYIRWFADNM